MYDVAVYGIVFNNKNNIKMSVKCTFKTIFSNNIMHPRL